MSNPKKSIAISRSSRPCHPSRQVKGTVADAVRAIMAAENWLLDRIPRDQKLVIVMGEVHESHMHMDLQRQVLAAHKKSATGNLERRFAFGYELPHNFLSAKHCQFFFPQKYRDKNPDDPHGSHAMEAYISYASQDYTPGATVKLFEFCEAHKISVSFNDVADKNTGSGQILDQDDPLTAKLIKKYRSSLLDKPILRTGDRFTDYSDGIAISNLAMVENALSHMKRTRSRLYIQHCGLFHALGFVQGEGRWKRTSPFTDSLAHRFEESGCAVLPVIPGFEDYKDNIPAEAHDMLKRSITIDFRF